MAKSVEEGRILHLAMSLISSESLPGWLYISDSNGKI
jgi:hypothetical protein